MPYGHNSTLSDRVRVELIEADVEQAFGLVDLAEEAALGGKGVIAAQILNDAERVLRDIDERLAQLTSVQTGAFGELISELRKSVDAARSHIR